MKKVFILFSVSLTLVLMAESSYETGKIDMHGGGDDYKYESKKSFTKKVPSMSDFLDKNSSKKSKTLKY